MQIRKKQVLDGTDKEILRFLYKNGPNVGRQIAINTGLTPAAIAPRLRNLHEKGIIKPVERMKNRHFKKKTGRTTKLINSSRGIYWAIDLKK